jgi:3-hydroxyisobutyrate dehydrogenase
MKIALLGTGLLGSAVARRLAHQGHEVRAWNRSPERAAPLADAGIHLAEHPAAALDGAEMAILLLSDAKAIAQVVEPLRLKGQILIQMGTIAPEESRALATLVQGLGGGYLEAPVLGSLPEAESGRLILMAGGAEVLFQRCLPLFQALGQAPRLIGPVGQAAALKLAMNQLIGALTAGFAQSLALVQAEGVAVDDFMELLRQSALYAPTYDKKLDKYLGRDYGKANFPLKHLGKDLALFIRAAQAQGLAIGPTQATLALCHAAEAMGFAELDYSALYEAVLKTADSAHPTY